MREKLLLGINSAASSTWIPPFRDGLPTPPNDMSGVAYNAVPAGYGGKSNGVPFHPSLGVPSSSHFNFNPRSSATKSYATQSQPSSSRDVAVSRRVDQIKSSKNSTPTFLEIPSSIKAGKGNLAEFAAQMTCFFWFEKTAILKAIEDGLNPYHSLVPEAIPTIGFQKWATTVLSTTQVSQNVILLALLFIYRMKKFNSGVKGKKGSECRLLTIALMLGNKFLDDNTYTNKTWAEVSGIPVQEIHIMEVEFLSNIRYNLFVSKEEWESWHSKLSLFAGYFNEASQAPTEDNLCRIAPIQASQVSPSRAPTTQVQTASPLSRLPSPPLSGPLGQQSWNQQYLAPPQHFPDGPVAVSSRKRGRDEFIDEPPMKRIAVSNPASVPGSTLPSSSVLPPLPPVLASVTGPPSHAPMVGSVASRLPCPPFPSHGAVQTPPPVAPQLPAPAGRAVPTIYNPPANWVQPLPTSAPMPPVTSGLYNAPMTLPEPVRPHRSYYDVPSTTVSPAVSAYSVHTPQMNLSPSFILANRNSPYRPVRAVNTLLIPPPSASLQPRRTIPFDHMHYQPLGRPAAESKTGLLPYLHHGAWPQDPFNQPAFHHI